MRVIFMLRNEGKLAMVWGISNGLGQKGHKMKNWHTMNLQLFADNGDGNPESGLNGGGTGSGESKGLSFDDFLKESGNQAEFDRRTQKAIETALTNAKAKWQAMADDRLSEAEKLAKMTKEEKAQYMQQKKEKELTDREAAITRKELMAEAKNTLAGKSLPQELAEMLNYADADSCNKSIAAVEKAFQSAVQKAVEERIRGKTPMRKAPQNTEDDLTAKVRSLIIGK